MESDGSLPCLQIPAIGPNPEPDSFNPHFASYFSKIHSVFSYHLHLGLLKWSLTFGFSDNNFVCISRLPCALHAPLISTSFILSL
jgi:hypothetical protein